MGDIKRVFDDMEIRRASTNTDYSVAMSNDMIRGASKLTLNELKLLRTIIMQIKPDDKELYPYRISVKDFQDMTGCTSKNLYSLADKMTDHLLTEIIRIGDGNPKHKWKKFQWVSMCEYSDGEFLIKLHDALKPYVLGLQKFYTKFSLEDIALLRSTHSIRLLELIYAGMKNAPVFADKELEVYIPIDEIRRATNTENKYERVSAFREKVIDAAISDINENNGKYYFSVREYKSHRKIMGYYFKVEGRNWHEIKEKSPERAEQLSIKFKTKKNP